jgi:predicted O-methyltransferase YrrM
MIIGRKISKIIEGTDQSFAPYYNMLPTLIRERGYERGIEIGVFVGGHAQSMLDNTDLKLLIGIDPYKYYNKGGAPGKMDNQKDYDTLYYYIMNRLGNTRYIHFRMTSDDAVSSLENGWNKFDFVFIDGLHTYDQVKKDLFNYDKLIRKGGVVACHDYNHSGYPGVSKAIDEFALLHNAKIIEGPLYAIYMEKTWE